MANFDCARVWMLGGLKVCRPSWMKHSYWYEGSDGIILYSDDTAAKVLLSQIDACDWEVWKDKKTLSDEGSYPTYDKKRWYREDKVKKAIKDLREKLKERRDVNCKPMVGLRELREFERGYNMAYNHFDIIIHRVFGLELTEREDGKCKYCDGNGCVKCSALHALDGDER